MLCSLASHTSVKSVCIHDLAFLNTKALIYVTKLMKYSAYKLPKMKFHLDCMILKPNIFIKF